MTNKKSLPLVAASITADINNQADDSRKEPKSQPVVHIGERYGRLTIEEYTGTNKWHSRLYRCRCDCGNESIVVGTDLKRGKTKSCGCYQRDRSRECNTIHGLEKHPLYKVWATMKDRCENPKNPKYRLYGKRGVKVCDAWHDFKTFYDWAMENGYERGLTLDRIDVNGDYEPNNCRWATIKEQNNNKRDTIYLLAYGQMRTISEWSEITGIAYMTIYHRIRCGHIGEQALAPVGTYRKRKVVQ